MAGRADRSPAGFLFFWGDGRPQMKAGRTGILRSKNSKEIFLSQLENFQLLFEFYPNFWMGSFY
jgi:hypothetical protein